MQLQGQITRERNHLALLRKTLAKAKEILRAQLVSQYESQPPDLVSVILSAHGFNDLLEQLNFLGRAKHQQQSIISSPRRPRQPPTPRSHGSPDCSARSARSPLRPRCAPRPWPG